MIIAHIVNIRVVDVTLVSNIALFKLDGIRIVWIGIELVIKMRGWGCWSVLRAMGVIVSVYMLSPGQANRSSVSTMCYQCDNNRSKCYGYSRLCEVLKRNKVDPPLFAGRPFDPEKYATVNEAITEARRRKRPLVIDFYATWCGPCRMYKEHLKEFIRRMGDRVLVYPVDTDANKEESLAYNIVSLPTTLIFARGVLVESIEGAMTVDQLTEKVKPYLI